MAASENHFVPSSDTALLMVEAYAKRIGGSGEERGT